MYMIFFFEFFFDVYTTYLNYELLLQNKIITTNDLFVYNNRNVLSEHTIRSSSILDSLIFYIISYSLNLIIYDFISCLDVNKMCDFNLMIKEKII